MTFLDLKVGDRFKCNNIIFHAKKITKEVENTTHGMVLCGGITVFYRTNQKITILNRECDDTGMDFL